jgi:flagellar biosynthesis component FlhA
MQVLQLHFTVEENGELNSLPTLLVATKLLRIFINVIPISVRHVTYFQ